MKTIKYKKDRSFPLERFYDDWTGCILRSDYKLDPDFRMSLFMPQIRKAPEMAWDLENWDRMIDDDADKTYEWLLEKMEDKIKRDRQKYNDDQHDKADFAAAAKEFQPKQPKGTAAAATGGGGWGKAPEKFEAFHPHLAF